MYCFIDHEHAINLSL